MKAYPLVIAVDDQQRASATFKGGLGHIPVTFTGLTHPRDVRIRVNGQSVDHWQTDWDPINLRWQITCNIAAPGGRDLGIQFESKP